MRRAPAPRPRMARLTPSGCTGGRRATVVPTLGGLLVASARGIERADRLALPLGARHASSPPELGPVLAELGWMSGLGGLRLMEISLTLPLWFIVYYINELSKKRNSAVLLERPHLARTRPATPLDFFFC